MSEPEATKADPMCDRRFDPDVSAMAARLGRPLRVLHIGNIANNAYNNAKIQRQYGIEADVLCYDYYHVMATPEWEDGGLTDKVDPDLPNWWATNLGGFKRPDWYVQGPMTLCLDYLEARNLGQTVRQESVRRAIEDAYIDLLREKARGGRQRFVDPRRAAPRRLAAPRPRSPALRQSVLRRLDRVVDAPRRVFVELAQFRNGLLWPLLAAAVAPQPGLRGGSAVIAAYEHASRLIGRHGRGRAWIEQRLGEHRPELQQIGWRRFAAGAAASLVRGCGLAALSLLAPPARGLRRWLWGADGLNDSGTSDRAARESRLRHERAETTARRLLARATGPAAADPALRAAFEQHVTWHALNVGHVLRHYDIIQGYSIDGITPLANGHRAFASYEHGTLRELPFERSLTGLLCNVAYRCSPAVFVTNTDVLPSVDRLGLDPARVHYLPHAFDDQKLVRWRHQHADLVPPADEVVLFSPTRQHWRDANRSLTKGNDTMLRAAGRLHARGHRFRLVLVEWGQDVAETKRLLDELGLTAAVRWVPPMGKQDLWRAYVTSHAVLDQFILPALGGVGFETLALGCRLVSRTDQATLARFFGAAPPVLAAADVDEVEASLARILADPADTAGIGAAGRAWIEQYHSARRTVAIQAHVYAGLLEAEAGPQPRLNEGRADRPVALTARQSA